MEVDVDIDDFPVQAEDFESYNEFESVEIEIPDDIDLDGLSEIDNEELFCLEIPIILEPGGEDHDGADKLSSEDTVHPPGDSSKIFTYQCSFCSRNYKRKFYYEKHILVCGESFSYSLRSPLPSLNPLTVSLFSTVLYGIIFIFYHGFISLSGQVRFCVVFVQPVPNLWQLCFLCFFFRSPSAGSQVSSCTGSMLVVS